MPDPFQPHIHEPHPEQIMQLESAIVTIPKSDREIKGEKNQDTAFQDHQNNSFGIFDGMGGHAAGDIAARIAKKIIHQALELVPQNASISEMQRIIDHAFRKVHAELILEARRNGYTKGMGTTATALRIFETTDGKKQALVAHVGDSRVYRLRHEQPLEQLTIDDGIVKMTTGPDGELAVRKLEKKLNQAKSLSELTDAEQFMYSHRNYLISVLGVHEFQTSFWVVDIEPGDRFLLTTDGVHDNLTDFVIEELLAGSEDAQTAVLDITGTARRVSLEPGFRSKQDDITAVAIFVPDVQTG